MTTIYGLFQVKWFNSQSTEFWEVRAFNPKNGNWYRKDFPQLPSVDEVREFLKSIDPDLTFLSL